MNTKTPIELGLIIRNRRRSLHLTQTELAARADVGRQWLVAVEQGKPGAELGLVMRTLTALGLALSVAPVRSAVSGALADATGDTDIDGVIDDARTERP